MTEPVSRSQSLRGLVPLVCELHKCFSGVFSIAVGGTGQPERAQVEYFPSPAQVS